MQKKTVIQKQFSMSVRNPVLLFTLVWAALASLDLQASSGRRGDLIVRFVGFTNHEGELGAYIVNRADQFLSKKRKPMKLVRRRIDGEEVVWVIRNLQFGNYAIAAFHDQNNNNHYDLSSLGIPQEAYGFSNNVRGRLSAPSFEDASFKFGEHGQTLTIEVRNFSIL
jgi:uncharacterized protein (DUF2141 family)